MTDQWSTDPTEIVQEALREFVGDGDGADADVLKKHNSRVASKALRDFGDEYERIHAGLEREGATPEYWRGAEDAHGYFVARLRSRAEFELHGHDGPSMDAACGKCGSRDHDHDTDSDGHLITDCEHGVNSLYDTCSPCDLQEAVCEAKAAQTAWMKSPNEQAAIDASGRRLHRALTGVLGALDSARAETLRDAALQVAESEFLHVHAYGTRAAFAKWLEDRAAHPEIDS